MSHFIRRLSRFTSPYVCSQCLARYATQNAAATRSLSSSSSAEHADLSVLSLLEERGLIHQVAGNRRILDNLLGSKKVGFYAGIDPTAPSLHLGHLLPLMPLFWLYRYGHKVVSLVGGATSQVGDPSGRLRSRETTSESVLEKNFDMMSAQLGILWNNLHHDDKMRISKSQEKGTYAILDNTKWLEELNILQFLKMMGNGARLGTMLGRETVKNKMEKGDGMSFSEFTYPLLQAWDWWHMYQDQEIQVQIGGSDQYGNIVAGADAVKYIAQNHAYVGNRREWLDEEGKLKEEISPIGLTVPLLTNSRGEKFGKSAGNAVWLDRKLTSSFDLYGFLLRSADDDVERYLKLFTFVPVANITALMVEQRKDPGKRKAQHLLASEVLKLVHGPEEAEKTREEHQAMRNPTFASVSKIGTSNTKQSIATQGDPTANNHIKLPSSLVHNTPYVFSRILYYAGLVESKSKATRLIAEGGAYIASTPSVKGEGDQDSLTFTPIPVDQRSDVGHLLTTTMILRTGKWKTRVIEVIEDEEFDAAGLDVPGWSEWKMSASRGER